MGSFRCFASVATLAAGLALPASAHGQVVVRVDNAMPHQTMEGFGATTLSLAYGAMDNVRADLRPQAIDALYNQVRLNMGNLEAEPCEAPASNVFAPANDDGDPSRFNAAGFNWIQSDNLVNRVVNPARAFGFDNYYVGALVKTGFALGWAPALRASDYNRYLDEIAEHVAAVAIHWRDAYGVTPRYLQLFNEPLSGNRELVGGTPRELVDIVKRAGARLRREGFAAMRFVVPAEETEAVSLANATAILADAEARPFVGAIAYHPYPYGSTYAAVPNILRTSGAGAPDAAAVDVRRRLRDLGRTYGVPVFMNEVSHSELPFDAFDGVRGRAIHIHDELTYADAAAFFGMNAMWDTTSHMQHFAGRADPGFLNETDTIVLIDNAAGRVMISPMGRAIGHYARWIRRGSVRVEATSSDPLVQVTAFRDDGQGRVVLVAINNATAARTLSVELSGVAVAGMLTGEQSTAAAVWQALSPAAPAGPTRFTLDVPARSVTTLAGPIAGAGDAGVVDGGGPGGADARVEIDGGPSSGFDGAVVDAAAGTDAAGATDGRATGAEAVGMRGGCGCRAAGRAADRAPAGLAASVVGVALWLRRRRRSWRA